MRETDQFLIHINFHLWIFFLTAVKIVTLSVHSVNLILAQQFKAYKTSLLPTIRYQHEINLLYSTYGQ